MAIYRNIHLSFWQDTKVTDDFTPEDRYFYLYLLTNPHTNLCGCYEISVKQMANEMGYDVKKVNKLIDRFSYFHNLIRYSQTGRELLIFHWSKYNWTSSEKFRKPLLQEIQNVKTDDFREYLLKLFNGENVKYGIDTVSGKEKYGINTNCMDTTDTVTDTDSITGTVSDSEADTDRSRLPEIKEIIQYLNDRCGTRYRYQTKGTQEHINARLKEGYTVDDFKIVIDKKFEEWHGTDMEKFLRPETLFAGKFESYLNQKIVKKNYHSQTAQMLDSFYDQTAEWVKKMEQEEQENDS